MAENVSNREFASSVSLVVTGSNLKPSDVSTALGIEPDSSWQRGDAKRAVDGLHEWGCWKKHLPGGHEDDPFTPQLQIWVDLLEPRTTEIRALQELGCHFVLACFISVSGVALVELTPGFQKDLASLGIDVRMTIWAGQKMPANSAFQRMPNGAAEFERQPPRAASARKQRRC